MSVDVPGHLYLGTTDDDAQVQYEASNLTTHGVIVGMTGSGKTGLGVIALEEALLSGVPTLVIDPKGDMTNLALTFPDMAASDFRPWVSEAEAQRNGQTPDELAAATADLWKNGLARSGIDAAERIGRLRSLADFTIYTPGSRSGVPVNVVGSLDAPAGAAQGLVDPESMQDEIDGFTSSLLGMVGVDSDPLSGREHILIANIIHHFWSQGRSLDIATLIGQIQSPPMRKLGVIDLETFFPPNDRMKLALQLNGLVASPSFGVWAEGVPLDIGAMLFKPDGSPRCAIVSINHLSDQERQFVVTLLLSKVVTWMRSQSGTTDLRALIYMDEVFGFVPPTAAPPSKKPILTILKQARAFGVGLILSTQNPVDLDYKAISNAGTWMIGRLQTERDQQRLLDGMKSSSGEVDIDTISSTISSLEKRQFVLHSTKSTTPTVFGTRWAMSYLAGPMTREQIAGMEQIAPSVPAAAAPAAAAAAVPVAASAVPATPELADDESTLMPQVADDIDVRYLDPAAPWSENIGAVAGGRRLVAGLAVRAEMLFDDTSADLRHEVEWEAVLSPLSGAADPDEAVSVDYDDRDLRSTQPEGTVFVIPDAKIKNKTYFSAAKTAFKDEIYREQTVTLYRNKELKLYSRPGESRSDFEDRCKKAAEDGADEDVDKLREAIAKKEDRVKASMSKAQDRIREIESDADARSSQQKTDMLLDVGGAVLGGLLGGRRSTRSILGGVRRSRSTGRMRDKAEERLSTAENRLTELVEDLEELEDELLLELGEIQDEWDEKVEAIDEFEVGLEKTDINIDDVALIWIPTD